MSTQLQLHFVVVERDSPLSRYSAVESESSRGVHCRQIVRGRVTTVVEQALGFCNNGRFLRHFPGDTIVRV